MDFMNQYPQMNNNNHYQGNWNQLQGPRPGMIDRRYGNPAFLNGPFQPPVNNQFRRFNNGPQVPRFGFGMNDNRGFFGMNWQGPGPFRPRHRYNRGPPRNGGNRNNSNGNGNVPEKCCQCGDFLQNSGEDGIHLCDANRRQIRQERENRQETEEAPKEPEAETSPKDTEEETLDAKLEKILENIKGCLRDKYESVTEALEDYVSGQIDEIHTMHRENTEEKARLEALKKELEQKATDLEKLEKELKEKQRRLEKNQSNFEKNMKKEQDEIRRRWQQLNDEIARMEEVNEIQKGRVKLDVGGEIFTTSRLTLTRDADSMLGAMFSGRHDIVKEEDGSVFIDRDGTHFRFILNYLRDGGVNIDTLPKGRQVLKELRKEAIYYNIHGLVQLIEKLLCHCY